MTTALPEIKAQGPGLQPSKRTTLADTYQTAYGNAATDEQLDWFETQDQPAMLAHITGMGAQQKAGAGAPAPAAGYTPETLNGMQGYRMPNGGWVPGDHPIATAAGAPSVNPNGGQPTPGATPGATPAAGTPGATSNTPNASPGATPTNYYGDAAPDKNQTQAGNASTFSTTPGAAPTNNTTNQGGQDVFRNELMERMVQNRAPDRNDPVIRAQADAYSAAQERGRRGAQAAAAEKASVSGAGAGLANEERALTERAAQSSAGFEADLVGREVDARRTEIQQALQMFGATLTNDQRLALEREMAQLNAALDRERTAASTRLGEADINSRNTLGHGRLALDAQGQVLQNKQYNDRLGLDFANSEAGWNQKALENMLGR